MNSFSQNDLFCWHCCRFRYEQLFELAKNISYLVVQKLLSLWMCVKFANTWVSEALGLGSRPTLLLSPSQLKHGNSRFYVCNALIACIRIMLHADDTSIWHRWDNAMSTASEGIMHYILRWAVAVGPNYILLRRHIAMVSCQRQYVPMYVWK